MAETSLRVASREQRRARLEHVALELFRTRGFDQVTVEDVCAQAGVAPATFYRYFGTKEDIVFAYLGEFRSALETAIEDAAGLPESARLGAVLTRFAEFMESQRDLLALRDQIVVGHPRLMQRTLGIQRELESTLSAGLAGLRDCAGHGSVAQLEAGIGILVLRVALRSWRARGEGSLLEDTRRTIQQLRDVVLSTC